MKAIISIFCVWQFLTTLSAAEVGIKVSGEQTLDDFNKIVINQGTSYLDLHQVVIKRAGEGKAAIRKSRSNIVAAVVWELGQILNATPSIQLVNLYQIGVDHKARLGGYRFGRSDITEDVLDALKKLFSSIVFRKDKKLEFLNIAPFGNKFPSEIRRVSLSHKECDPTDLSKLLQLKDLQEVFLDEVTFCFRCTSIYINKEREPEELMLRGVNGIFEKELKKLRDRGIVVHGTAILRQESRYLGWPKKALPVVSSCKIKIPQSFRQSPVFIEGFWDDSENGVFRSYLREHLSWWNTRSEGVDQD